MKATKRDWGGVGEGKKGRRKERGQWLGGVGGEGEGGKGLVAGGRRYGGKGRAGEKDVEKKEE